MVQEIRWSDARHASLPNVHMSDYFPSSDNASTGYMSIPDYRANRTLPAPSGSPTGPSWLSQTPPPSDSLPTHMKPIQRAPISSQTADLLSQQCSHSQPGEAHPGSAVDKQQATCVVRGIDTAPEDVKLQNEAQRLKERIRFLDAQIEDLHGTINDLHKQSAAKDIHFSRIIANASQLEHQTTIESQRWREDREIWKRQKQDMEMTISSLRFLLSDLRSKDREGRTLSLNTFQEQSHPRVQNYGTHDCCLSCSTTKCSASAGQQSAGAATTIEESLRDLQRDSSQLSECSQRLVSIGQDVQRRLDSMQEVYRSAQ